MTRLGILKKYTEKGYVIRVYVSTLETSFDVTDRIKILNDKRLSFCLFENKTNLYFTHLNGGSYKAITFIV